MSKEKKDTSGTPVCGCSPGDISKYAPAAPDKKAKVKQKEQHTEEPAPDKKRLKADH